MPDEISKALELGKAALPYAASVFAALSPIGKKICGMVEGEIDIYWGIDQQQRRIDRLEKVLRKSQDMVELSGRAEEVKEVPAKLLQPWMEAASLEDEEEMRVMWAALLANAALQGSVIPAFVAILKEMTPDEAKMLACMYRTRQCNLRRDPLPSFVPQNPTDEVRISIHQVRSAYAGVDDPSVILPRSFSVTLERLQAFRAIKKSTPKVNVQIDDLPGARRASVDDSDFEVTSLGVAFIEACQAPKKPTTEQFASA
ncbi:MAG: DUF4393 domain-containing protein [Bryobacteraceae bacterium]|nr:DUF4393 domain-containing protein [Bryobacteraceae bacterium]